MRTTADASRPGWKGPREVEGSYFTYKGEPCAVVIEPDMGRAGNLVYGLTRTDGDDAYTVERLEGRRFAHDDYNDQDYRLYEALHESA